MLEFSSISVSSYDAASLADRLTEKSAQGWELVAIVPAGTNVTAYLSRPADGDGEPATSTGDDDISFTIGATPATSSSGEPATAAAITTPEAAAANAALAETDSDFDFDSTVVSEPAGWGSEPASRDTEPEHGGDSATDAVTTADVAATEVAPVTASPEVVDVAPAEPAQQAAAAAAAAPAGWYADPAGRYELRYWDGGQWTEHVSRAGQQFTDPPVA